MALLRRINGELDEKLLRPADEAGKKKAGLGELLKPGMRRALAVGIRPFGFWGSLQGVNIVIYYGPTIFGRALVLP